MTTRGAGSPGDAFRGLYAANFESILGYALRRVAVAEDAADVVAETFVVAWRRLDDVPPGAEARLWLFGVARRVLANQARGDLRRDRLGQRLKAELSTRDLADDPVGDALQVGEVRAAMARLADLDREILELSVWEQLAPREIAQVLELSGPTVRTRLKRARIRLRAELVGHDPPVAGHVRDVRPTQLPEEAR